MPPIAVDDLRRNRLLAAMGEDDQRRIAAIASVVQVDRGERLSAPGELIDAIHFPCEGALISLAVPMEAQTVEAAVIGHEGAIGGLIWRAPSPAFTLAFARGGGSLVRVPLADFDRVIQASPGCADTLARYVDCFLSDLLQMVACLAAHPLEQRMARWLLCLRDRHGDTALPLTQDDLAGLLGVGRTYVSRMAGALQERGIIRYRRGRIEVADAAALEGLACGCRAAVIRHFARVLPGVHPADSS